MTRTVDDRIAGLVEQIRRDIKVLEGPPTYCAERAFYEDRIAANRVEVVRLTEEKRS